MVTNEVRHRLPRHIVIIIFKMVVKDAPRDQMRILGIRPGKLKLPNIIVQALHHTHGFGSATLSLRLPENKQYSIQRVIHYTLPLGGVLSPGSGDEWERCSVSNVRGHPDLPAICEGEETAAWYRTADGEFVLYDNE